MRCPRCGGGDILINWFNLKRSCPTCSLAFERGEESDYWLGAYTVNLVVAEGTSVLIALLMLKMFWPDIGPALWVGATMVILSPIAFFPFSRTLWLAIDLTFRRDEDKG